MTSDPHQNAPPDRVLITAGPTHEPIDAVRYLANRSSGRMGIALAETATARGHPTTLVLGPTTHPPPDHSHLTVCRFLSTAELQFQLARLWPEHDLLLMTAAVADYRPVGVDPRGKLRRRSSPGERLHLELEATPDLLQELARTARPDQCIVGFALEPAATLLEAAAGKLRRKGLDAIVANPLPTPESSRVTATVLLADGSQLHPPPDLAKPDFARWLFDQLPAIRTGHAAGHEPGRRP